MTTISQIRIIIKCVKARNLRITLLCVYYSKAFDSIHRGRTVLIQKDPAKGTVASNYRRIACLPIMWKLLTGIFSEQIYDHLKDNNLLPDEQKGCRKRSRGTKDQLLIHKAITLDAKRRKRCLNMAWHGMVPLCLSSYLYTICLVLYPFLVFIFTVYLSFLFAPYFYKLGC